MPLKETAPALRQLKGRRNLFGAEIGVYRGEHAAYYLKELDIKLVLLIDPYTRYENYSPTKIGLKSLETAEEKAHVALCKHEQKIEWVREQSSEAAKLIDDASLDFIYIDGNHSYEFVAEDLLLYYPKLKKGGLFAGHDYDIESVKRAVDEFMAAHSVALCLQAGAGKATKYDWWIWKR